MYIQRRGGRKDRPSRSLDHKWWGPFKIKRQTGPQDYEIILPSQVRIHPVINVCNLKKHLGGQPEHQDTPELNKDQQEYEVEEITGERKKNGRQYRMKWKGYATQTWEPEENLKGAPEIVKKWKKEQSNLHAK